jgi:hypothetical protein
LREVGAHVALSRRDQDRAHAGNHVADDERAVGAFEKAQVTDGMTGRVEDFPPLGDGPREIDHVALDEQAREWRIDARRRELVTPERQVRLFREERRATHVVFVVMRDEDRLRGASLRRERCNPVEPRSTLVVVGRRRLDQEHLARAKGIAVRVRRRG